MEKLAPVTYAVHELIQKRWSPRAFSNRSIERDKLLSILEAGRWAASSNNRQPWRFIIAERSQPDQFETMLACLREGNQEWAKEAPVLMLAVAQTQYERNNELHINRHAGHDTGMALAHMVIQATSLDIYAHMMGGFYPDTARDLYQIPATYEPMTMVAMGYYGDPAQLPDSRREQEGNTNRERKALSDMIFEGSWSQSAAIVDKN
ncbi:MAG: nitroreductase family protein [Aggregatilineales bacterium]